MPVRHHATFSNVSALVLPEGRPVADYVQTGMFSHAEPEEVRQEWLDAVRAQSEVVLQVVRDQAAALREITALNHMLVAAFQLRLSLDHAPPAEASPDATPTTRNGYGPSNPRHRTWRGFVLDLQRQVRELPKDVKPTKTNVATHGGDTVRAINYAMLGYGLKLSDWAPDHWNPDEDRCWQSPKTRHA